MSSNVTSPSGNANTSAGENHTINTSPSGKGKAKAVDTSMEDDEEDEEEEEEEMGSDEEDEEEEEEEFDEIDPSAIIGGRRTRGVKVDYTSKEALAKAGLQGNEKDEESDEDIEMK
ncbi:histone H2A.Z-specific chaperone CHZ1 [Pholiota molesta]|nr:histone H2A.Z-specific chaperone CHZ1 [Pholiota molesta]